uniref:C3H1-type domain-containing protein n=2 Tax=Brassica oleracea TaxID=3712 RepID=A0A3P6EAJ4_BRAOL|nr:unnamed protein product [Brassica oleracea]
MAGHKWNEETRSGTTHGSHIKWVLRRITTAQNLNPTTKATVQNGAQGLRTEKCERRRGSSSRRTSPARISELPKGRGANFNFDLTMSDSGGEPKTSQQEEASQPESQSQSKQVCTFFKKPSKAKNLRKRPAADADEEDADSKSETSILNNLKKAAKPDNKLFFSSGPSKTSSTTTGEAPEKAVVFHYDSSKEIQVQNDSRATATLETETDFNQDARAIRERVLKRADEALKGNKNKASDEKLYTGIHGYTDHKAGFRREQTISSEKAGGSHGPLRASAHIRVSARFDYQPDICKDYKETGYCGYGDSCKFLHDRGDYKPGWQIEKEWEEAEKIRKRNKAMGVEDEDDDDADSEEDEDALPFACFICREAFVDPVVTKCKHYFCEHCALKHHTKNKKCFVCNQPTMGIFNAAHEIKKRMAEERSKAQGL